MEVNKVTNLWMVDVIEDCLKYSKLNNLKQLEKSLKEVLKIARIECSVIQIGKV